MLSRLEKEKLIKQKNYNDIICEFFPNELKNKKPFELCTSNILKSTGHLSRGTENITDSTNFSSICFSLDNFLQMYIERKFNDMFKAFKLCLENLCDHIKKSDKINIKERLDKMLFDNIINFNCFYNGLKIITLIEKHDSNYKIVEQFTQNNFFSYTEKIYKKAANYIPEEDVKSDIKTILHHFVAFLTSLDEKKYKFFIDEYNKIYYKFI